MDPVPSQTDAHTTYDVFISHAWGDRDVIEPLIPALEAADLTCWDHLRELKPGDNLPDGLNEGLTNSKVVLFCLSDNFLRGKWTTTELNVAFTLCTTRGGKTRMIPLMLTNPDPIIARYPMELAGMKWLRWGQDDLERIVTEIKRIVAECHGPGFGPLIIWLLAIVSWYLIVEVRTIDEIFFKAKAKAKAKAEDS